jgi:hypothetical protein
MPCKLRKTQCLLEQARCFPKHPASLFVSSHDIWWVSTWYHRENEKELPVFYALLQGVTLFING